MRTIRTNRIILGLALTLSPAALGAQDPATLPGSPPTQPQMGMPSAAANSSRSNQQQDSNATPGMTGLEMKDKIFLRKAAEGGIAEVKMGQLAATKGSSEDVKTFGSKMVADHTQINNEMKPIADSMGVRLPREMNKMDQAEYDKLNTLSGEDFDKEYIAIMVKDHRKDVRDFRAESTSTQEPSLKEAVDKAETIIREHTRMIMKIAKERGIATPPPPGHSIPPSPTQ